MQAAIGYLRVSTREQGRSGLGLAAQRHDIETFAMREGFAWLRWAAGLAKSSMPQSVPVPFGRATCVMAPDR
jgi:DNA invertase Pin-like site-specific DNA recombinase